MTSHASPVSEAFDVDQTIGNSELLDLHRDNLRNGVHQNIIFKCHLSACCDLFPVNPKTPRWFIPAPEDFEEKQDWPAELRSFLKCYNSRIIRGPSHMQYDNELFVSRLSVLSATQWSKFDIKGIFIAGSVWWKQYFATKGACNAQFAQYFDVSAVSIHENTADNSIQLSVACGLLSFTFHAIEVWPFKKNEFVPWSVSFLNVEKTWFRKIDNLDVLVVYNTIKNPVSLQKQCLRAVNLKRFDPVAIDDKIKRWMSCG